MIPPGLAFISISPKAWKLARDRDPAALLLQSQEGKEERRCRRIELDPVDGADPGAGRSAEIRQADRHGEPRRERADAGARRRAPPRQALGLELFSPRRPALRSPPSRAPTGMDSGVIVKEFRNSLRRDHRQRPGLDEGPDFPHRAPRLLRFRRSVRDDRRPGNHPPRQRVSGGIRHRRAAVQGVYADARSQRSCSRVGSRIIQLIAGSHEGPGHPCSPRYSMNILIAEPLAPAGVELFQGPGRWNVIVSNPKEYAAAPGRRRRAAGAQRRAGERRRSGESAEAARDRPRGRRAWTTSIWMPPPQAGVLVMNTPGRERHLGGRAHAGADAGDGAAHSAGQRLHARRQVGEEEVHGQRAARQDARRRRAGQHRARSGEARPAFRDAHRRRRPVRHPEIAQDLGVELVDLRPCTRPATTSRCTLPPRPRRRGCSPSRASRR